MSEAEYVAMNTLKVGDKYTYARHDPEYSMRLVIDKRFVNQSYWCELRERSCYNPKEAHTHIVIIGTEAQDRFADGYIFKEVCGPVDRQVYKHEVP